MSLELEREASIGSPFSAGTLALARGPEQPAEVSLLPKGMPLNLNGEGEPVQLTSKLGALKPPETPEQRAARITKEAEINQQKQQVMAAMRELYKCKAEVDKRQKAISALCAEYKNYIDSNPFATKLTLALNRLHALRNMADKLTQISIYLTGQMYGMKAILNTLSKGIFAAMNGGGRGTGAIAALSTNIGGIGGKSRSSRGQSFAYNHKMSLDDIQKLSKMMDKSRRTFEKFNKQLKSDLKLMEMRNMIQQQLNSASPEKAAQLRKIMDAIEAALDKSGELMSTGIDIVVPNPTTKLNPAQHAEAVQTWERQLDDMNRKLKTDLTASTGQTGSVMVQALGLNDEPEKKQAKQPAEGRQPVVAV